MSNKVAAIALLIATVALVIMISSNADGHPNHSQEIFDEIRCAHCSNRAALQVDATQAQDWTEATHQFTWQANNHCQDYIDSGACPAYGHIWNDIYKADRRLTDDSSTDKY